MVKQKNISKVGQRAGKTKKKISVKSKSKTKPRSRASVLAAKTKKRTISRKKISVRNKKNTSDKIVGMRTAAFGYLVAGIFELVMAIPFLGWLIGVGSFGVMWVAGIIINIVVIVALINRKKPLYANIVAITANVLGMVPILGWGLHLLATILLFVLFFKEEKKNCKC